MRFEYYVGWHKKCNCNFDKSYFSYKNYVDCTGRLYEHKISEGCTFRTFMNKLCKVSRSFSYYRLISDYILSNIFNLHIIYNALSRNVYNKYDKLSEIKYWNDRFDEKNISEYMDENEFGDYNSYLNILLCIMKKIPNISKITLYNLYRNDECPTLDQLNCLFLMLQSNNKLYIIDMDYISLFNDDKNLITEQLIVAKNNVYFLRGYSIFENEHTDKQKNILKKHFIYA